MLSHNDDSVCCPSGVLASQQWAVNKQESERTTSLQTPSRRATPSFSTLQEKGCQDSVGDACGVLVRLFLLTCDRFRSAKRDSPPNSSYWVGVPAVWSRVLRAHSSTRMTDTLLKWTSLQRSYTCDQLTSPNASHRRYRQFIQQQA